VQILLNTKKCPSFLFSDHRNVTALDIALDAARSSPHIALQPFNSDNSAIGDESALFS
jgi:hypothetical protein